MPSVDVVVLGAGPAGLAAAWWAARTGRSVVVLERADRVGGLAGSFEVAGVRVDHGSHRLHPATPPDVLAELRALLGDDLQARPRHGRLRLYDSWLSFPLRPAELARAVPPRAAARIARDTLSRPLRGAGDDTFAGRLEAGLGPELYRTMYAGYARKLWGLDGELISGEQARRRVTADTPWKLAGRLRRRSRGGQGRVFHYPRRGFGQLSEALADAAVAAGADVRLGAEVTGVRDGAVDSSQGSWTGTVLSTLPVTTLARLSDGAAPAVDLRFRAMVLVYLVHEGGRWSAYDAHYLPGLETPVTRISEPANYRDSAADPADRSVLCAEIPCQVGDETWQASDDELADVVRRALATTALPAVRGTGRHVERVPVVYPVYRVGYEAALARLDSWAARLDRTLTLGRNGLFAHDNTHHALVMARDAVASLRPDGGIDRGAWGAALSRFAGHVVED
jgi:protoporphyrinogen oxidase